MGRRLALHKGGVTRACLGSGERPLDPNMLKVKHADADHCV